MKLTPLDIRHKEFKRGMRGYADVEVDEFLDQIADEYERLFKENIDLQDRVEALEEKIAGYRRIEETLQKTLVKAQASAEEQKQNANKQAQLILQDAELKARQLVNEAYSERQAIEQSMAKLKSAEEDFRFKFRQLLDGLPAAAPGRAGSRRGAAGAGLLAPRGGHQGSHRAGGGAGAAGDRQSPRVVRRAGRRRPDARPSGRGARGQARAAGRARRAARPEPVRSHIPGEPAVVPARGQGGVQAGVHRPSPEAAPRERPGGARGHPAQPAPDMRADERTAAAAASASSSARATTCSPTWTAG